MKANINPSEVLRKSIASKQVAVKERSSLKKESLIYPQPVEKQERICEKQREGHLRSKTVLPVHCGAFWTILVRISKDKHNVAIFDFFYHHFEQNH